VQKTYCTFLSKVEFFMLSTAVESYEFKTSFYQHW